MQLSELKLITASNIISLRTGAGMTQAELGAKLNYSDKSVSKWERGEAIPDAFVLTEIAEIFGVTVDYLLSSHDGWSPPGKEKEAARYSADMIIAVSILGVWTMSLAVFVVLWLFEIIWWQIFFISITLSLLTWMIELCVFKKTKYLPFVIAGFVLSMFVLFYVLMLPIGRFWQIFIVAVPALVIVFLSFNIRIRPGKKSKKSDSTENREVDAKG